MCLVTFNEEDILTSFLLFLNILWSLGVKLNPKENLGLCLQYKLSVEHNFRKKSIFENSLLLQ
jgi:hypothetical protein